VIVFTVIIGKSHVNSFFDIALNSLITKNNLPSVSELPSLLILTTTDDIPHIRARLQSSNAKRGFGDRIRIIANDVDRGTVDRARTPDNLNQAIGSQLLIRAIVHCIEQDECFCNIPPETVCSDGVIHTAWALHRITGKTVSVLRGPVLDHRHDVAYYNDLIKRPMGVRDEFVKEMAPVWSHMAISDPTKSNINVRGHSVFMDSRHLMILTHCPSPIFGKFKLKDLDLFLRFENYSIWNRQWVDYLHEENRHIVQTNLDFGMLIELIETDRSNNDEESQLLQARRSHLRMARFAEPKGITGQLMTEDFAREQRFNHPFNAFVFSTLLTEADSNQR
jgi:hypothetical protein